MLVKCSWCGFSKDVPTQSTGGKARCPVCGKRFAPSLAERRASERFPVKDIYVQLGGEGKCEVKDLAADGLAIYAYYVDFDHKVGSKVTFGLMSGDKVVATGLEAEVVRVSPEVYGLKLAPLDEEQHSLVQKAIREGFSASQQDDDSEVKSKGLEKITGEG